MKRNNEKEKGGKPVPAAPQNDETENPSGIPTSVDINNYTKEYPKNEPAFLTRALEYAQRGWHVFPVKPRCKKPGLVKWGEEATTDSKIIKIWWSKWPNANIGVATGPSGLCVVDLDVKDEKNGVLELEVLEIEYGDLPKTLIAETPSGGRHLYFKGEVGSSVNKVAIGIDIRGWGGYVLAPGSSLPDGSYSRLKENPVANLPNWLAKKIDKKKERQIGEAIPPAGFDNEPDLNWAKKFLEDTEPYPEGAGSDHQCYSLACRLRERGLSKETAIELMALGWDHPHDPEWVIEKIENAFSYSRGATGSDSIMSDFPDDLEPLIVEEKQGRFLNIDSLLSLLPPEWLVQSLIPKGSVGVLYGPSGSLKSFLALHLSACLATGIDAFPGKSCQKADAFYIAAEGGHGFTLRLKAWIAHHGIKPERLYTLLGSVYLNERNEVRVLIEEIQAISKAERHKIIVVDTLSANFTGNENTDDVACLIRHCNDIAKAINATVLVVHHTGKVSSSEERGHYSIRANVDFSIRMDKKVDGAIVDVRKLKDTFTGKPLRLNSIKVEVDPNAEFSSSLVLVEEPKGASDFEDESTTFDKIFMQLELCNGMTLHDASKRIAPIIGKSVSTAKKRMRELLSELPEEVPGGLAWLERIDPNNSRSGLKIHFKSRTTQNQPVTK